MYERINQPVISRQRFYRRLSYNLFICLLVLAGCLVLGTAGFHFLDEASWLDAFHNSAMLLGGMGPVVDMHGNGAKLFSSFYALFAGIVFITNSGILLAPIMHRVFHRLHVQEKGG
ncbi:hypothetical protein [Flavihumibacter petaseus]|uniref:Potassium channel domain-containing protein n=1 Tax=Flavihumibacter petaseus NBRC 106054 TaxID=1220578 RepID=A0A0E9MXQ4_9BACT|nr:hypothetical protein [Flavihumibacter petaseus]GAO42369.1 hypothetical protein FPE01S_01_13840 [Flavihumibacter petaseus NBRC 106054]